jgi:acetyl/propionyl-CoA carboxylase alpha subunit
VIEEAPAPGMTADLRAQMGAAAVEAARAVGYVGAGTVEFVADGTGDCGRRLLVHRNEYPAPGRASGHRGGHRPRSRRMAIPRRRGRKAAARSRRIRIDGHAVEARVYAEDPENGFLPSTGTIVALNCRTTSASTAASKRAAR